MIERHHTIPISLGWPDTNVNMMDLEQYYHREVLHHTLDIPARRYSKLTRNIKMKQNDKMVLQPETIEKYGELQKEFFENIHRLPVWMIEEHNLVMANLSQAERDRYYKMTNTYFDNPRKWRNNIDTFDKQHENYIECRIEIAKDILSVLKKHYSM